MLSVAVVTNMAIINMLPFAAGQTDYFPPYSVVDVQETHIHIIFFVNLQRLYYCYEFICLCCRWSVVTKSNITAL